MVNKLRVVKLCGDKLCGDKLGVSKRAGGSGAGLDGRGGSAQPKQEPHTKMWGRMVETGSIFYWDLTNEPG